jgi:hypothetical protein
LRSLQLDAKNKTGKWKNSVISPDVFQKREEEILKLELRAAPTQTVTKRREEIFEEMEDLSNEINEPSPLLVEALEKIDIFHQNVNRQLGEMNEILDPLKEQSLIYQEEIQIQHDHLFQRENQIMEQKQKMKNLLRKI